MWRGIAAGSAAAGLLWALLEQLLSMEILSSGVVEASGLSAAVVRYTGALMLASLFAGIFGGMTAAAAARLSSAAASGAIGAGAAAALAGVSAVVCAVVPPVGSQSMPGFAAFSALERLALPLTVCGLVGGCLSHFLIVTPGTRP